MGFQNKFQERIKAKDKHFRITKSRPTRNHLNQYFEKFLRKIMNFKKKIEELSKNIKKKKFHGSLRKVLRTLLTDCENVEMWRNIKENVKVLQKWEKFLKFSGKL